MTEPGVMGSLEQLTIQSEASLLEGLEYDKLPIADSIRLLQKIEDGDSSSDEYLLMTFTLDEAPPYVALSYTWGSQYRVPRAPQDERDYHITCNDQLMRVTENLYKALPNLSWTAETYMWIDAICINQQDLAEKSIQVGRMGSIYANASSVLIWLGDQDDHTEVFFDLCEKFVPPYVRNMEEGRLNAVWIVSDSSFWDLLDIPPWTDKQLSAITHFFGRAWFDRAWCIQEIALAKNASVCCGNRWLPWYYLIVISLFVSRSDMIARLQNFAKTPETANRGYIAIPAGHSSLSRICKDQEASFEDHYHSGNFYPPLPRREAVGPETRVLQHLKVRFYKFLECMITYFVTATATRPEDKIYAPLALVTHICLDESNRDHFFQPDYKLSATTVFTQVCVAIINNTQSLSILSQVGYPNEKELFGLPSWVPDFTNGRCMTNINSNPRTFPYQPLSDALAGTVYVPKPIAFKSVLLVQALICDVIIDALPAEVHFVERPSLWINIALKLDETYFNGQSRGEVLWRTMICDTDDYTSRPARDDIKQWAYNWLLIYMAGSPDLDERFAFDEVMGVLQFHWPELDDIASSSRDVIPDCQQMARFRWQHAEWKYGRQELDQKSLDQAQRFAPLESIQSPGKRIFLTSESMLGHGPEILKPGDVVAFILGAKVPVILRPTAGDHFNFVGETYLHGFMHGEILKHQKEQFVDIQIL